MEDELQKFADAVTAMCEDYTNHDIPLDYIFYAGLNLRMLIEVCKVLYEDGKIDFDDYWFSRFD